MITHLDHLVLTVPDIPRSVKFNASVLGMHPVIFGEGRTALFFGLQKINLHEQGRELEPKASHPTSGSADLCFITDTPLVNFIRKLNTHEVEILEGPVLRTGAQGSILSVYFRDPDGNPLEVSNQS